MILFLRGLFFVVIASMLWVTSWATMHQSLGEFARGAVIRDPWVVATLVDAYWAFLTFYVWVAWKEQSLMARALWFIAILLLGNLAMATYMLVQLFAVSCHSALGEVFTRRQPGKTTLPAILAALALGIYFLA